VRGRGAAPTTAAKAALGVKAFMNAALGVRFLAGALAATFLAGAAFAVATFFAGAAFLAGVFFAVAMWRFLSTEVGSKPETLIWPGFLHANGENQGFQVKKLFFTCKFHCCCYLCHVDSVRIFTIDLPKKKERFIFMIFSAECNLIFTV
jgi:hypothetical protein